jgi:hypothetical protein
MFRKMIIAVGCACLLVQIVIAQDAPSFEQGFLYRDGDQLMFVNPYVEPVEAVPLPGIVAGMEDQWAWSPDGRYLIGLLDDGNIDGGFSVYCLNLYDFEAKIWIYDDPIACGVEDAAFTQNMSRVAYSTNDGLSGTLWLFTRETGLHESLYHSDEGQIHFPHGINQITWSPTEQYLTFSRYDMVMGGAYNLFQVMRLSTGFYYEVLYDFYASFYPVWSPNDEWFLAQIQEEYAYSGALPLSNHEGDLFLFHAADGQRYRLTFTPADAEWNIHWTADGRIAYRTMQDVTLSLSDAIATADSPPESMVTPEPFTDEEFIQSLGIWSPGNQFLARILPEESGNPDRPYLLSVGDNPVKSALFTTTLGDNTLIGWRPAPAEPAQP